MDDDLIDRKNKLRRMLPVLAVCLWLFSANIEQDKITWAEGTSAEKMALSD